MSSDVHIALAETEEEKRCGLPVFGRGDVFGEMTYLLERPRSRDVYAVTDGVRVLSLSEATLRQLIKSDPAVAATLLLNVSKMLCLRLLMER